MIKVFMHTYVRGDGKRVPTMIAPTREAMGRLADDDRVMEVWLLTDEDFKAQGIANSQCVELAAVKKELAEAKAERDDHRMAYDATYAEKQKLADRLGHVSSSCTAQRSRIEALEEDLSAVKAERDELKSQMEAIEESDTEERNRNAELRQTINQMMETSAKDVERYQSVYAELAAVKARIADAPKVWLLVEKAQHDCPERVIGYSGDPLEAVEMLNNWKDDGVELQVVHAVPVSEKEDHGEQD